MLNRVCFVLVLGVLVLLPLLIEGSRPMYWGVTEVIIYLTFAAWFVSQSWQDLKAQPALRAARWPIALLIGVCLLILLQAAGPAGMRSIDVHATWEQLGKSVSYLCLFILMLALVDSTARLRAVLWTLLLCGTFQAVYGILGAVHSGRSAAGSYVDRDHFAGYLEMALAAGIGLLMADLNRNGAGSWRQSLRRWINVILGPKAIVRICLVLMVIALIMSHSRMGNTAFFSSMLVAAVIGLTIFRQSSRGVVLLFTSMIIIDTLLMGTYFGLNKLTQRFEQTQLNTEGRTIITKLEAHTVADSLAAMFAAHGTPTASPKPRTPAPKAPTTVTPSPAPGITLAPRPPNTFSLTQLLLGNGAGTYYTFSPLFRSSDVPLPFAHAHDDYVEFTLNLGLVGALLLATFMAITYVTAIRAQIRRRSRLPQAAAFATMMAATAILIHETADFNLEMHANAATFVAMLALPYIAMTVQDRRREP